MSYTFLGDNMELKVGDYVTRKSYQHDIVFLITKIENNIYYLKGKNVRLCADAKLDDLVKWEASEEEEEAEFLKRVEIENPDRSDYFYLPGKILHIDGDNDYLNRCLKYYEDTNIWAVGFCEKEENIADRIIGLLEQFNPNIVVITGHDAMSSRQSDKSDLKNYRNSQFFVNAIKKAREYENSHEKLIVIAGGCQSNYEELIKAGANFASSPKRVNIHALDPAIIATKMSLSDINKNIDLKKILETTKYGSDGVGGIITKGTMYMGYPR